MRRTKPTQLEMDTIKDKWDTTPITHIARQLGISNNKVARIGMLLGLKREHRMAAARSSPIEGAGRAAHFERRPIQDYGARMREVLESRPSWFDEPNLKERLLIR